LASKDYQKKYIFQVRRSIRKKLLIDGETNEFNKEAVKKNNKRGA